MLVADQGNLRGRLAQWRLRQGRAGNAAPYLYQLKSLQADSRLRSGHARGAADGEGRGIRRVAVAMHTIRLREPWDVELQPGGVLYRRHFNRPTGLQPPDVVRLAIDGLRGDARVGSTPRRLPAKAAAGYIALLSSSPRNAITVEAYAALVSGLSTRFAWRFILPAVLSPTRQRGTRSVANRRRFGELRCRRFTAKWPAISFRPRTSLTASGWSSAPARIVGGQVQC